METKHKPIKHLNGFFLLCFLILLALSSSSFSDTLVLHDPSFSILLGKHLVTHEDTSQKLTINDIVNEPHAHQYYPNSQPIPGYGFTPSAYWIRISVLNKTTAEIDALFEIGDSYVNAIEMYVPEKSGFSKKVAGINYPFSSREFFDRNFIFNWKLQPEAVSVAYIRMKTNSSLELPFYLHSKRDFQKTRTTELLGLGIFYGIVIVFMLLNLILALLLRDLNYLYYSLVIFSFGMMQAVLDGFTYMFFWPNHPLFHQHSFQIFSSLSVLWGILFGIRFLFPDKKHSAIIWTGHLFIAVLVIQCTYSFFGSAQISGYSLNILTLVSVFFMFISAIISLRDGFSPARYYLVAWTLFLIGIANRVGACSGILPHTQLTFYSIHLGIIAHIILTSFALAYRLRLIQKENEHARLAAAEMKQTVLEHRLIALQEQVKPHFLFNTLNTIANMVIKKPVNAENALIELSSFYRKILRYSPQLLITIQEELEIVHSYLQIEKTKMEERLQFSIASDQGCTDKRIPFMAIQVLVENSIKHGIHPLIDGGTITISTILSNTHYSIIVDDNGLGFSKNSEKGNGLKNLRERLDLVFPEKYSFTLIDKKNEPSLSEQGVRAILMISME